MEFLSIRCTVVALVATALGWCAPAGADEEPDPHPFGVAHRDLDGWATGGWWTKQAARRPIELHVPRQDVIAFALYTVTVRPSGAATLKLTAQLFPLLPGEPRRARLEIRQGGGWVEVAQAEIRYPGWDAHFRVDGWDATRDWPYRVRHGDDRHHLSDDAVTVRMK